MPLTRAQWAALDLLRRARRADPSTDDGLTCSVASWYDGEVEVAWVHWRTAEALARRGLIRYGDWDPEYGRQIVLVEEVTNGSTPASRARATGRVSPEAQAYAYNDKGCPYCGAPAGDFCHTPTGKPRNDHAARRKAATNGS